ncbi:hypothetical protein AVEN_234172-1 [Araneus ventricosus]|uniref:Uncharacterized protein n=1 Tax=Araneus ventricosus TaxID=182803 RepID=A0A4Y2L303_ARAVE|nr:hypothetical protein AVEN_234172-1 [Araneus ventricosus]
MYGMVVPVELSVHLRKVYDTFKVVSDLLKCLELHWIIYMHKKMLNILLDQQQGFKKLPCCLCMCDSLARKKHCAEREWPVHENLKVGMPNMVPSSNNCQPRNDRCSSTLLQVWPDGAVCQDIQC